MQCELNFQDCSRVFTQDCTKVTFAQSYLKGIALEYGKTGFTPEVTPRKSSVEGGWDLASPYVVRPCLHA